MKFKRFAFAVLYLSVIVTIAFIYSFSSGRSTPTISIYNAKSPNGRELNIPDREFIPEGSSSRSLASVSTNAIPLLTPTSPAYITLPILYLVQAEKCLPPYLQSNDVLGNGSLGFEVIVLSYKEACDNPPLRHIQYFLNSTTTWTTGRNFLFEAAMNRNKIYLYYIFMDDDVVLIDLKNSNPWRKFEAFLRSVEPAIAAVDLINDNNFLQMVRNVHRDRQCSREEDYIACVWFDAIFNAFHYNAVHRILPYDSTFDTQTWYASQMAVIARSEVLFRGQVVLHTEVVGENKEHRPYPKSLEFSHEMFKIWLSGLAERHVPPNHLQCANVYVHQWITMEGLHGWNSSTMCLPPPPPHDVIEPGRYACA
ncbi:hypothetical protein EMCRGX_G020478 [Ephydatia muelleri]|eukprot:Em0016g403a